MELSQYEDSSTQFTFLNCKVFQICEYHAAPDYNWN